MRNASVGLLTLVLLFASGCGETPMTPEQIKEKAFTAGNVAALTYLAVEKPSKEQATAIKVVIDLIQQSCANWPTGGFKSLLPDINKVIDEKIPVDKDKALNLLAKKLAETLTTELDALFNRHPDWKTKGAEVAGIVGSFAAGASKGFEDYLK